MTSCLSSRLALPVAHTIRKRYEWTQIFFTYGWKISVFENTRQRCKIKYDSKTLVWTQIFLNMEKKSLFSKMPGHAWTGYKKQISIGNKNCHFLTVCYCTSVYGWSVLGSRVGLLPINRIVSVLWFLAALVRIGRWEILPGCPLCNVWLDCVPLINFQSNQSSLN